jgi:hypothetical protein
MIRTSGILFTIVILLSQNAFANVVVNSGFEFPDISGDYVTYTEQSGVPVGFGWSMGLGSASIDHVNAKWSGVSGTNNSDGYDQSIFFKKIGSVYQQLNTTPGQVYRLSFYYSHSPYPNDQIAGAAGYVAICDKTGYSEPIDPDVYLYNDWQYAYTIFYDHLIHKESNSTSDMKWRKYEVTFQATSENTILAFQDDWSYNSCGVPCEFDIGIVVDKVSISALPSNRAMPWIHMLLF